MEDLFLFCFVFVLYLKCISFRQGRGWSGRNIYLGPAEMESFCCWFYSRMEDVR